ncbi:DNA cytosine methyltransferase [Rhizobium ruizarguesonis]|nr:DNA cytosine methyltransferase [Rhizobium ruizarguesonis]
MRLAEVFCGTGGFSSGAHRAGFKVAAAFDIDPILTSAYKKNFPNTNLVIADVGKLTGPQIIEKSGGRIDGLFGGPPCQGFSSIGLRQPDDHRRELLRHFFRLVLETEPSFFIMENVPGLWHGENRRELLECIGTVDERYHVAPPMILNATDFGAATKRSRLFVIGTRKGLCDPLSHADIEAQKKRPVTVSEAIYDLMEAVHIGDDVDGFDYWQLRKGTVSGYASSLRSPDGRFTGNRLTKHTSGVVERFSKVSPGTVDKVGRHFKLSPEGFCPTIRAGTGSDRGSYQAVRPLHPLEPRVITVREAARLQGFPDDHVFHPTVWHSFRMIGNSVSPIMGKAIFDAMRHKLEIGFVKPKFRLYG